MDLQQSIQHATFEILALEKKSFSDFDLFRQYIIKHINDLINKDFPYLMFILYRIDISEEKIKTLLQQNKDGYAAEIITDLIIERQKQKALSRQQFKSQQNVVDDNECEAW